MYFLSLVVLIFVCGYVQIYALLEYYNLNKGNCIWYFSSMLIGVLIFVVDYFAYNIVIRDMINVLPHLSIAKFLFLNALLKIFIFNYDKVAGTTYAIQEFAKKNKEICDVSVEYNELWKIETKYRFLRLLTVVVVSLIYYFLFIDKNDIIYELLIRLTEHISGNGVEIIQPPNRNFGGIVE